jgi:hypothetical protein
MFKSGILRYAGYVAHMGDRRGAYRILLGRPHGKETLGSPRRRWGDNTKIGLLELGWGSLNCTDLVKGRDSWESLVNA